MRAGMIGSLRAGLSTRAWVSLGLLLVVAFGPIRTTAYPQFTSTRLIRPWAATINYRDSVTGEGEMRARTVRVVKEPDWHDMYAKLYAYVHRKGRGLAAYTASIGLSKSWTVPEDGIYEFVFAYSYRAYTSYEYEGELHGGEWAFSSAKLSYGVYVGPARQFTVGSHSLVDQGATYKEVDPTTIPLDSLAQAGTALTLNALGLSAVAPAVSKIVGQLVGPVKVYSSRSKQENFGTEWMTITTDRNLRVVLRKGQEITLFTTTLVGVGARGRSDSRARAELEFWGKLNYIEVTKVGSLASGGTRPIVEQALMSKYLPGEPSYKPPEADSFTSSGRTIFQFSPFDQRVVSWVRFGSVSGSRIVQWNWYSPDGNLYWSYVSSLPDTTTRNSLWSWIGVAGRDASTKPGIWRVEVLLDGEARLAEQFFVIGTQ